MRSFLLCFLAAPAVVFACTGGAGTASSGGTSGSASLSQSAYCDARETRSKTCVPDGSPPPTTYNRTSCSNEHTCALALYLNPDGYLNCRANPDCTSRSTSDDRCLLATSQGRVVPQSDTCAKKYAECKAAGGRSFDDDTCPALAALNDASLTKLAACLDRPCDQISDCIKATIVAISPACD